MQTRAPPPYEGRGLRAHKPPPYEGGGWGRFGLGQVRHFLRGRRVLLNDSGTIEANPFERRLVERFRQGDARAMSTLFEMHVDRVYGYARHILGNREDAEEVAAEAFIRAFRGAAEFRGDSPFHGWLFAIARNLCRDRQRQPRLLAIPTADMADPGEIPESVAIKTDVRAAMRELPEEYQEVLIMCDVEEWNAREVSLQLGKSLEATKSLLYRARRTLRDRLAERWNEEPPK